MDTGRSDARETQRAGGFFSWKWHAHLDLGCLWVPTLNLFPVNADYSVFAVSSSVFVFVVNALETRSAVAFSSLFALPFTLSLLAFIVGCSCGVHGCWCLIVVAATGWASPVV